MFYCRDVGRFIDNRQLNEWITDRSDEKDIPVSDLTLKSIVEERSSNDEECTFLLGRIYESGIGVDKSYEKAEELYTQSAEKGFDVAQFVLGLCYECGILGHKDLKKAAEWYSKAAAEGDGEACVRCGEANMQLFEDTGDQSYAKESFRWFNPVAYDYREASIGMVKCYMYGIGTKVSLADAENFLIHLDAQGYDTSELKEELAAVKKKGQSNNIQ